MNEVIKQLMRIEPVSLFIGMAIGICLLTIIILWKRKPRREIDLSKLKEKVFLIDQQVQESQKNNIIAHKELHELYEIFKQLENNRREE